MLVFLNIVVLKLHLCRTFSIKALVEITEKCMAGGGWEVAPLL